MPKQDNNSYTVFGWLREDGTVSWDRDEIIGNVRHAIREWKNSDYFLKNIEQEYDKHFKKKPD